MRSYWMSLTLVAVLLLGYTAIVLNSHSQNGQPKMEAPRASAELQPREPAAQAAVTDSPKNVD
jgi:hypothetical protein